MALTRGLDRLHSIRIAADAQNVVGGKVAKDGLLADIYEAAKASIGLPVTLESDAVRMYPPLNIPPSGFVVVAGSVEADGPKGLPN